MNGQSCDIPVAKGPGLLDVIANNAIAVADRAESLANLVYGNVSHVLGNVASDPTDCGAEQANSDVISDRLELALRRIECALGSIESDIVRLLN